MIEIRKEARTTIPCMYSHADCLYYPLGNTLYPLKVSGKPVSEEEHTVTLFYAVPISVEGTAPCMALAHRICNK